MNFLTLPPELALHLLAGEEDLLTAEMETKLASIKAAPCPRCGSQLQPRIYAQSPFSNNDPLPRLIASCECGFQQDPKTGIVLSPGSAANVKDPLPIVKP